MMTGISFFCQFILKAYIYLFSLLVNLSYWSCVIRHINILDETLFEIKLTPTWYGQYFSQKLHAVGCLKCWCQWVYMNNLRQRFHQLDHTCVLAYWNWSKRQFVHFSKIRFLLTSLSGHLVYHIFLDQTE